MAFTLQMEFMLSGTNSYRSLWNDWVQRIPSPKLCIVLHQVDLMVCIKCQFGYLRKACLENELEVCFAVKYVAIAGGKQYGRRENLLQMDV